MGYHRRNNRSLISYAYIMAKTKIRTSVLITAIIALAAIEGIALFKGIDGTLLAAVIAIIAGLAGWIIPSPIK